MSERGAESSADDTAAEPTNGDTAAEPTDSDTAAWPADNAPSPRWPIYTRGNVGEVYPEVVLPLEWDLAGLASERGWRRGAEAIGFLRPGDYGPGDFVMIGVFGGYAYFNASLMRLLGVRTPGLGPAVIDEQFLGEARTELPGYEPRPGDRSPAATVRVVISAARTLLARSVPQVDEMRTQVDRYRADAPLGAPTNRPLDRKADAPSDKADAPSDDALWHYLIDGLERLWEYLIASHVTITMQSTIAAGRLTDLCANHLGDPNLAVTLTTGIGDVVSAEPARELWRLANDTPPDRFDDDFETFLAHHGHRGPNEFSLAGRDWATNPDLARTAIETMRGADPDRSPVLQAERMAAESRRALAEARRRLGRRRGRSLEAAVRSTALWSRAREASKNEIIRANQPARHAFAELLRRAAARGGTEDRLGPMLLSAEELRAYLADPPSLLATIERRSAHRERLAGLEPPFAFDARAHGGTPPPISTWSPRRTPETTTGDRDDGGLLTGAAGAPGVARGVVRVVTDPADPRGLQPGEILVAPLTDPSWTPLFVTAAGVVVEVGAAMSHSMIVSRELGIPCVVGVADATMRLTDGVEVEIDGGTGTVRVLG